MDFLPEERNLRIKNWTLINPQEHPCNPALEIKFDALHRCYELDENIKYVMDVK